jgi:hypothetical protein
MYGLSLSGAPRKKAVKTSMELYFIQKNVDSITKLHAKVDRGDNEESTSRSLPRRQQKYANKSDLV